MTGTPLTIGQLARAAGVNASAIRYWERVGVLPPPERTAGRRRYGDDTLRRLEVIGRAKRAGLSLDEIRPLLEADDAGAPMHARLRDLAERKLLEVDALIARAEEMRAWLEAARRCTCASLDECGLFAHPA